jgi:hypothetical protein
MTDRKVTGDSLSREQRLAAKLRENLRLRKAQARAKASDSQTKPGLPNDEGER